MSSEFEGSAQINRAFGERLGALRRRQGLSAQQLSQRLTALGHELSRASISQTERGARTVTLADLLALAEALSVSPVLLMLDFDDRDGPRAVEVFGGSIGPAEFVEWWSGRLDPAPSGQRATEWEKGMSSFDAWQDWIRARAYAELQWETLNAAVAHLDPGAPKCDEILSSLARTAARAEREADTASQRLPWTAPGSWKVESLVKWLSRLGARKGVIAAVASELRPDQLREVVRAAPSWAPLVEPHIAKARD